MNTKDIARALLWAAAALFLWQIFIAKVVPPAPVDSDTPEATEVADGDTKVTPTVDGNSDSDAKSVDDDGLQFVSATPATVTLGSAAEGRDSAYRMAVTLTNVGASIVEADLSDFNLDVTKDSPRYPMLSEVVTPDGGTVHSFSTDRIYVGGWDRTFEMSDLVWKVESRDREHVVFATTLMSGSDPVFHLRKTFTLPAQPAASRRHDLLLRYEIVNATDEPLRTVITHGGPVGLRREDLRFNDRILFTGTRDEEGIVVSQTTMNATHETPLYRSDAEDALVWTAVANKYFVVFSSPVAGPGGTEVDWINEIVAAPVDTLPDEGPFSTFVTTTQTLTTPAGGTRALAFDLYLGPKDRKAFRAEYAERGYDEQVLSSYAMGACAFLTPKSFVRFMIWMLNSLKAIVMNYGIAIIILVMIVRTILHPITKKGQVNMMRVQQQQATLAPKMEEIKKRFANDKTKMNQEIMKMYQEEGANPAAGMLSSCLPMFLQMPIWIALFTSLNYNIDMRHQPFCLWIRDLAAPDALIRFAEPVHVPVISAMTGPISSFNLLPILVSIAMFAQQKLMPKPKPPPGQSDEQSQQAAQMQKMMPYMTLVFGLFFYNMPSGLNLYIGTSSFFGAIEQHRIRKHVEALKDQPPPPRRGKGGGSDDSGDAEKAKKAKGPSFFQKLQKAAEEAQKVKSTRQKSKPRKK